MIVFICLFTVCISQQVVQRIGEEYSYPYFCSQGIALDLVLTLMLQILVDCMWIMHKHVTICMSGSVGSVHCSENKDIVNEWNRNVCDHLHLPQLFITQIMKLLQFQKKLKVRIYLSSM